MFHKVVFLFNHPSVQNAFVESQGNSWANFVENATPKVAHWTQDFVWATVDGWNPAPPGMVKTL